jgi:MFS family permease
MKFTGIHGNVLKYYFYKPLSQLEIMRVITVLFLLSNDLSFKQILLLQAIHAITITIMEVPTGAFADIFGRKKTLISGSLLVTTGCFFYCIGSEFAVFTVGELLWATGTAIISGADDALLYDTLKQEKAEDKYKKIIGNIWSLIFLFEGAGSILGGLLATISFRIPIYATFVSFLSAVIIAFSFQEPEVYTKESEAKFMFKQMKESVSYTIKKKVLSLLILYAAVNYILYAIGFYFYQPYMKAVGINISLFGVIYLVYNCMSALGSKYASEIEGKIGTVNTILLTSIFRYVPFIFMATFVSAPSVVLLLFVGFSVGLAGPIFSFYINKHTPSEKRATIISLAAMSRTVGFSILSPLFGWLADLYSFYFSILLSGILLLLITTVLQIYMRKHKEDL